MQREIFTQDHDEFRDMVRAFIAKEIAPYHEQWERDGVVSRDVWLAAGRAGRRNRVQCRAAMGARPPGAAAALGRVAVRRRHAGLPAARQLRPAEPRRG